MTVPSQTRAGAMPEALYYEPWTRDIGIASGPGPCSVGTIGTFGTVCAVITLCPVFSAAASLQWPSFVRLTDRLTDETDAYQTVTAVMFFEEHENQAETYSC